MATVPQNFSTPSQQYINSTDEMPSSTCSVGSSTCSVGSSMYRVGSSMYRVGSSTCSVGSSMYRVGSSTYSRSSDWSGCTCSVTERLRVATNTNNKCDYCKKFFAYWSGEFKTTITNYPQFLEISRARNKPTATKT